MRVEALQELLDAQLEEHFQLDVDMSDVPQKTPAPFPVEDGKKVAYGVKFDVNTPDWLIELKLYHKNEAIRERQIEQWGEPKVLEAWQHFIHWALHFYGPGKEVQFIWHPWAVRMIRACCHFRRVGFAGSSSCGKSEFGGIWLLGNLLVDHWHTLCIATTASLREAQERIWGSVKKYYHGMPEGIDGVVTKYVETPTPMVKVLRRGKVASGAGIKLVPADSSQTGTKTNKLQGVKAYKNREARSRMFLFGDEFTELSHALRDTLETNLSNNDEFHAVAAANPNTKVDPFGLFVKPTDGWQNIDVELESWQIEGGICLHFDAMKNPNWEAKQNIWPIQKWEKVQDAIDKEGENTARFWRNFRAFWPPVGVANSGIFSDAEITQHGADELFAGDWFGGTSQWVGVDTAFKEGGDRCILMIGELGRVLEFGDTVNILEYMELRPDTTIHKSPEHQIATQIIKICEDREIPKENLGIDATGGGATFCNMLMDLWESNAFHRVEFGGGATTRPISDLDDTPANQRYANRATELAMYAKELLRHKQLFGLRWTDLVLEMTLRKHSTTKSANGFTVTKIEDKKSFRRTNGFSPDIMDGMIVMLDTIRERGKMQGRKTEIVGDTRGQEAFIEFVTTRNVVLKANRRLSTSNSGGNTANPFSRRAVQPQMRRLKSW